MVVIPSALGIGYGWNSSLKLTGSRLKISLNFWAMISQISATAMFAASSTMLVVLMTMGGSANLVRLYKVGNELNTQSVNALWLSSREI